MPVFYSLLDLVSRSPVEVSVDLSVLEEATGPEAFFKTVPVEKK